MARALKPITIRGVRYAVLRLSRSSRGPRFLVRDDQGRIFGAWPSAAGSVFRAQLLEPVASSHNPLEAFIFNDAGDALTMRRSSEDDGRRGLVGIRGGEPRYVR